MILNIANNDFCIASRRAYGDLQLCATCRQRVSNGKLGNSSVPGKERNAEFALLYSRVTDTKAHSVEN